MRVFKLLESIFTVLDSPLQCSTGRRAICSIDNHLLQVTGSLLHPRCCSVPLGLHLPRHFDVLTSLHVDVDSVQNRASNPPPIGRGRELSQLPSTNRKEQTALQLWGQDRQYSASDSGHQVQFQTWDTKSLVSDLGHQVSSFRLGTPSRVSDCRRFLLPGGLDLTELRFT